MRHRHAAWRQWIVLSLLLVSSASATAEGPDELSDDDREFVLANTQFTVLHEIGHVVLNELKLPFLGSEEDAADQLASIALLLHGGGAPTSQAIKTLTLAAEGWGLEWQLERIAGEEQEYWDSHPLDIQRYYNISCLIYGSSPDAMGAVRQQLRLTYQRAWRCGDEFQRVLHTLRWIHESQGSTGHTRKHHATRVGVIYEPPAIAERKPLLEMIRSSGVLEQTARIAREQFALPADVDIVLTNLCGQTAYWRDDLREIILCYALADRFVGLTRLRPCLALRTPDRGDGGPDADAVQKCVVQRAGGLRNQ